MSKIFQTFILILLLLFISGCSSSSTVFNYSKNNKTLLLGKDNQNLIKVAFTNPSIQNHQTFKCVNNSYTLRDENFKYGRLFIESISLNSSCNWNGLSLGFFESNLRAQLNINKMQKVEEFEISSYIFRTYKINNDSYLSLIYNYSRNIDRFIIDYNGKLYDELIKIFKPDYKTNIKFQKRFLGNYNDSLVRKNLIQNYFEEERWSVNPKVGVTLSL